MKKRPFKCNYILLMFMILCSCTFVTGVSGETLKTPAAQGGIEVKTDVKHSSPFDTIEKTYAEINTLNAQFQQKIVISSLKKERAFEGKFLYKRHKGFLWQYVSPKGRYFLYDGKYIWQGEDEKPFVQKNKVSKDKTDGTFLDLVEDVSKLDELFNLKHHEKTGDTEVLELIPKKDSTIKTAKVWIDRQNMVKKIELHEFTGNVNTIEFVSIKVNQPIEDTRFIFKPDKQKEIIER
ncbi:MAG: outer membrane lipoprotein carrier protein LolA [Proteobacteria bacterium]|nr:outer membrane lipoprotein carrier protein LolA [Pseudomonadota bacterium]